MTRKKYWLMKSEPDAYSIDDLKRDKKTCWDGVRNYRARNFMRDQMKVGDLILYYHSNAKPPGVVGLARVCRQAYPDDTALDKKSKYYDPRATKDKPIWMMVDIEFVEMFPTVVPLDALKEKKSLEKMLVVQRGQRLSVQPVEEAHFKIVLNMAKK